MYTPVARERVKLSDRPHLFFVTSVDTEAQTATVVALDATRPYLIEDVSFVQILPAVPVDAMN